MFAGPDRQCRARFPLTNPPALPHNAPMYAPVPIRATLLLPRNLDRLRSLLLADPPSSRWAATPFKVEVSR